MTTVQNDMIKEVLCEDAGSLMQCLQDGVYMENPEDTDVFTKKDEFGRNVLMTASMLGRSDMVRELVQHGAEVNEQSTRGYSSLHLAACWGHLETVKTLIELEADTQVVTFKGERPVDLARRYSKNDCVDCLLQAEAKQDLISFITFIKERMMDTDKKLPKDEKTLCTRTCAAKLDWIQKFENPTVEDFLAQKKEMEEILQHILIKLTT